MTIPKAVKNLIESLERLPGIGPKSARRLTYYLLHVPEAETTRLANAVLDLKRTTVICEVCFNVAEKTPCEICRSPERDHSVICVVEEPLDVLAIEATTDYKGLYHVLNGAISPVNHIGPEELRISELLKRVASPSARVEELILATNPSMEGEATAMYIRRQIRPLVGKVTRIALGLPVGGDLEYADRVTLNHALTGRVLY